MPWSYFVCLVLSLGLAGCGQVLTSSPTATAPRDSSDASAESLVSALVECAPHMQWDKPVLVQMTAGRDGVQLEVSAADKDGKQAYDWLIYAVVATHKVYSINRPQSPQDSKQRAADEAAFKVALNQLLKEECFSLPVLIAVSRDNKGWGFDFMGVPATPDRDALVIVSPDLKTVRVLP